MQLDCSTDFRVWDNTQAIQLTSRRKTGDMTDELADVLVRAINRKELARSEGVYTGDDLVCLVPRPSVQALILQDRLPKPADDVKIDGTIYRVIGVDGLARDRNGYQIYKLTTRNLAIAYDLRDTIDIQMPRITFDAAGVDCRFWPPGDGSTPYAGLACRVQPITQEYSEEHGMVGLKGTHAITVASQVRLSFEERIKWVDGGVTYYLDVVDLKDMELIDSLPVIGAELRL